MRSKLTGAVLVFATALSLSFAAQATATPLVAWGLDDHGQLGDGAHYHLAAKPVAVDARSIGRGRARAIAAGSEHSLALLSDGTVLAWGDDELGQLGHSTGSPYTPARSPVPVDGLAGVTKIAAGGSTSLALLSDGRVEMWGYYDYDYNNGPVGTATPFTVLTGAVAIAAGQGESLAALSDGSVRTWGSNAYGQLGTQSTFQPAWTQPQHPVGLGNIVAVAAGAGHDLALDRFGSVYSWGRNDEGQLGRATASFQQSSLPQPVPSLHGVVAIAAGDKFSLALLSNGSVLSWGYNGAGELGHGSTQASDAPMPVRGLSGVTAIAAGGQHAVALLSDGRVYGWGDGGFGEIGDGDTSNRSLPVQVIGLGGASAIAAGGQHSLAIGSLPPDTSIRATTIQRSARRARFSLHASLRGARFECALLQATAPPPSRFKPCRASVSYSHLHRGRYTFYARAVGPGGPDLTPAKARFTI